MTTIPPPAHFLKFWNHFWCIKEELGNPSSPHRLGSRVRALINRAREEIGQSLEVEPIKLHLPLDRLNQIMLYCHGSRIVRVDVATMCLISTIEHPSILETAQFYFSDSIRYIPVDSDGLLDIHEFQKLLDQKLPSLVSLLLFIMRLSDATLAPSGTDLSRPRSLVSL